MAKIDFLNSIKQKPLTALCLFPSGLGKEVTEEIQSILSNPWIPEKKNTGSPKLFHFPEKILIQNISLQSVLGISFRSYFLKDIYILLGDIKGLNLIDSIPIYIKEWIEASKNFSIQLLIRKNQNLNPDTLHQQWSETLKSLIQSSNNSNNSSDDSEFLSGPRLLVNTIRNQSKLFLGIKSKPNYQRGFRIPFAQSAPLSEDLTSVLVYKLLKKIQPLNKSANQDLNLSKYFYIPFSGTGTIAFEIYLQILNIFPGILQGINDCAIQKIGGTSFWEYLTNKHRNQLNFEISNSYQSEKSIFSMECLDFRSSIVENSLENANRFQTFLDMAGIQKMVPTLISSRIQWLVGDFFEKPILPKEEDVFFLPLNPPYGIRHQNRESSASFFRRIASKIDEDTSKFPTGKQIHGFILCPDEAAYSNTVSVWEKNWILDTVHFSQGKLSIRAVFFSRII
jgi:23S rRNA G2445 N2-methylase RlmL